MSAAARQGRSLDVRSESQEMVGWGLAVQCCEASDVGRDRRAMFRVLICLVREILIEISRALRTAGGTTCHYVSAEQL